MEQWRSGSTTTDTNTLVLQYSSNGVNYVNLGAAFNFTQPTFMPLNSALDGNQPANRAASRGGTFDLPSLVSPGGTIFLRWFDANDAGTDPALAIDNFSFRADTLASTTIGPFEDYKDEVTPSGTIVGGVGSTAAGCAE